MDKMMTNVKKMTEIKIKKFLKQY